MTSATATITKPAADQSGVGNVTLDAGMPANPVSVVTDQASSLFFREQLTQLEESDTYQVSPNLTTLAFATDNSGGWREDYKWFVDDSYGEATISECCGETGVVGRSRCAVTSSALTIEIAASWCIYDVFRARTANEDLEGDYISIARQRLDKKLEELIWSGYTPLGVMGLFNNPTINRINVGGLGYVSTDLKKVLARVRNTIVRKLNGRALPPNTLAVPPSVYAMMQVSVVGNNDMPLMDVVQNSLNLRVIEIPYLEYADNGKPAMAMYRDDRDYVRLRVPFDTVALPTHFDGSHYCRKWFTRFGGVRVTTPESFAIITGLAPCGENVGTFLDNCQGMYTCTTA